MREYLVFCRGRPASVSEWVRLDALARIARAALSKKRALHLLFEDGTLISLSPEFIGSGPWGSPLKESSEARLGYLLSELRARRHVLGGNIFISNQSYRQALTDAISGVLLGFDGAGHHESGSPQAHCKPRFDLAISLRERGISLRFEETEHSSAASTRILVDIGGVRDKSLHEDDILRQRCSALKVPYQMVSLGRSPELTSKCMKTVEVAAELGLWESALALAAADDWGPPTRLSPFDDSSSPFLHIVVSLSCPLHDFIGCPSAAGLLSDCFVGSHILYQQTALSILGVDGLTVSVRHKPYERFPSILTEDDAVRYLACEDKVAASLEEVLLSQQRLLGKEDLGNMLLIHADSEAPPLCLGPTVPSPPGELQSIAVVFAQRGIASEVCVAGRKSGAYAHVAINSFMAGPAFVRMLHNEGVLMRAVAAAPRAREVHLQKPADASSEVETTLETEVETSLETEVESLGTAEEIVEAEQDTEVLAPPAESYAQSAVRELMRCLIRKFQKKIAHCCELQEKQSSGLTLNADEQVVLRSMGEFCVVRDELQSLQDLMELLASDLMELLSARIKKYEKKAKKIEETQQKMKRGGAAALNSDQMELLASASNVQALLAELVPMLGEIANLCAIGTSQPSSQSPSLQSPTKSVADQDPREEAVCRPRLSPTKIVEVVSVSASLSPTKIPVKRPCAWGPRPE